MASLIDRLLGRTEPSEAKAVTGPGAYALNVGTPLHSMSRNPNRLMWEAQQLYLQPWVNVAERAIVSRTVRLPWHLEDEQGDTIDETTSEGFKAILTLFERPSQQRGAKTRRQLWGITLRHLGLCGNAFWYLDQREGLAGTPLELLYINPARMTPAMDGNGNVSGWVLDSPENPVTGSWGRVGTPLSTEEVIHFTLDEADWGPWGMGWVESAQRKVELSKITDGYIGQVLGTGGRLTGILAPKDERTQFTDDEWKQFANDWRRIVEDPNAAKRLQIMKKPVEHIPTSMTPRDLLLPDVSKMSRDDVLAVAGVPLSIVGIPTPAGLNSGEKGKYDRQALYEGPIQDRGEALREKIQYELLDRFALLGFPAQLVLDYPNFDDNLDEAEVAAKTTKLPFTNDERRQQMGLDPLDPAIYGELGSQVYMETGMHLVTDEPPEPAPLAPPPPTSGEAATDEEAEEVDELVEGKADIRKPLLGLRHQTEVTWEPRIRNAVQEVLTEQRRFIASKLPHILAKPSDSTWWNEKREQRRFMVALDPLIEELATEVAGGTAKLAKKPGKADTLQAILDYVRAEIGKRITGINATTREKVQAAVAEAVEQGMSPADLGLRLRESAAFDPARAEMIARTETAYAYNDSAIQSYRELGTEYVQVIDGDKDAECAHADGATWSMDEALSNPIGHPNCTRDFIPVVKAVVEPDPMLVLAESMAGSVKAMLEREQPIPVVNVSTAPVNVYPPEVPPAQVTVNIPEPKATSKRIERDADGRLNRIVEE